MPATFKFVVSDNKDAYQVEKEQGACPILGKALGEVVQADFLGLEGYTIKLTGGSDKAGVPMHPDVEGSGRRAVILTRGIGFSGKIRGKKRKKKPRKIAGLRKRMLVRGNAYSPDIVQVNCKIEQRGAKAVAEALPKKQKEPSAASEQGKR